MKAYWGSGCIAPHILHLSNRWRWVVSFTPQPLHPKERARDTHCIGGWGQPNFYISNISPFQSCFGSAQSICDPNHIRNLCYTWTLYSYWKVYISSFVFSFSFSYFFGYLFLPPTCTFFPSFFLSLSPFLLNVLFISPATH